MLQKAIPELTQFAGFIIKNALLHSVTGLSGLTVQQTSLFMAESYSTPNRPFDLKQVKSISSFRAICSVILRHPPHG